jgi:hypothetical protein
MLRMVSTPMTSSGFLAPHCAAAVSDRLAFLNYTAGSLATTLSAKLNTARVPLKELRNSETALAQRRNVTNGLEQQISRVENSRERGYEKRLAELREQLAKAHCDDEPVEKQHDILLRKALRESERLKFQALREVIEIPWDQFNYCLITLPLVWRKARARRTGC